MVIYDKYAQPYIHQGLKLVKQPFRTRGGSRAIPGCSAYQVYYQSPDSVGPVCDHLLTRAQGHSALELPLITSFFGHLGAVLHGATTTEWFWI